MAEFFGSLSQLRQGQSLSAEVVRRAQDHCRGGKVVRNLAELRDWMVEQNPPAPFFDQRIASGRYPESLAAFVTSCSWEPWRKHAVYAMHGEIYLQRLAAGKAMMQTEAYRDNFAGASMHKANGYLHMARCAQQSGMTELLLPAWEGPLALAQVSAQAVADLRISCTLRSEKYGQRHSSLNAVKAYQAALRNLADALEVHARITGEDGSEAQRMGAWLRERATNLALTNTQLRVACEKGQELSPTEQRLVARDLRLAETAAGAVTRNAEPEPPDPEMQHEVCARCGSSPSTHIGFTCRCLCLCGECAASARVLECPVCQDFTEFVRA